MSTSSYEDREGTGGEASGRSGRLDQDPHEVTLNINGYSDPQGHADKIRVENITHWHVSGDNYINWKRIAIPELRLAHAAHLLFIQGISAAQFFLAASLVYRKKGKAIPLNGPLLFTTGKLTPPYESRACWKKLVIGQLIKTSSDKTNVQETYLAMARYESQTHPHRGA